MASKKPKTIPYRRRRENRTNYNKRLRLLLAHKPRLVVRISNQRIITQIVEFTGKGDKITCALDSSILTKNGWHYSSKNIPAAYLTGYAIAKKATAAGIKEAILDTGLLAPLPKSKIMAFLKGTIDGGLEIPHGNESIFPDPERISGKHIQTYAEQLKEKSKKLYEQRFGKYLKNNAQPEKITINFTEVKQKL